MVFAVCVKFFDWVIRTPPFIGYIWNVFHRINTSVEFQLGHFTFQANSGVSWRAMRHGWNSWWTISSCYTARTSLGLYPLGRRMFSILSRRNFRTTSIGIEASLLEWRITKPKYAMSRVCNYVIFVSFSSRHCPWNFHPQVLFVDYGNITLLPEERCAQLPTGLVNMDAMAFPCSLDKIKPLQGSRWGTEATQVIDTLTQQKGEHWTRLLVSRWQV